MTFRRYSFVVTDCKSGTERRFTLALGPALGGAAAILILPVLMGLGARWAVRTDLQDLAATAIALRMENDSYRDATGQLASQIAALQGAVDDIGARAAVDPAASRAMARLPAVVKSRAMGGGTGSVAPMLGSAIGSPDTALGVLSDLLIGIEDRLALVRSGVERRQALALATPSIWPVTGWLSSAYGNRRDPFTGGSDFHGLTKPDIEVGTGRGDLKVPEKLLEPLKKAAAQA